MRFQETLNGATFHVVEVNIIVPARSRVIENGRQSGQVRSEICEYIFMCSSNKDLNAKTSYRR